MRSSIAGISLALSIGASCAFAHEPPVRSAAELMDVLMWNREPIGGPYALVDQHGKRRTDADFRGKLVLVYFGFTACQDICPTDLLQIGLAIESLGPAGDGVQPVFITVDPARDTPKRLGAYAASFHPRLVALSGPPPAIAQAARAYRVYYRKLSDKSGYTVDHSAFIYLMDRDGKYAGFFPPGTPATRMAEVIRPLLP
jgi:cytochrome oxidase Cu insertion factor (SCO1/SenC/PrrC family)